MRAGGFVLLSMGMVLTVTTLLGLIGIIPLQVNFFGVDLDGNRERILFGLASAAAGGAGLLLLHLTKPSSSAAN